MNINTNSSKTKKFILALVIFTLFSFCCPKNVNANIFDDLPAGIAKLLWWGEKGALKFLNDIFTSEDYHMENYMYTTEDENGYETTNLKVYLTPENIIKGRFLLFDANIFKEVTSGEYYDLELDEDKNPIGTIAEGRVKLRETIASWYYALRNFAIVALLSVLVYVGIRMIISTMAQDKAKYKLMFKDWLIALCLVVLMHYMMIGILNLSTMIMDAMGGGKNVDMVGTIVSDITGILSEKSQEDEWTYKKANGEILDVGDAFAKILVLAGIIGYTFIFAVKYLKREFTIIFLILLGPVSCVTYPIDKISDGKAQAFNKWFSEFLYQVIIQPFHLLLYIVLVGSAAELAEANVLYALVCFAILIPSEKFVKEMFGFKDKLGSPLGSFAGGALASKALSSLFGGGKGGNAGGNKGEENNSTPQDLPPKTVDKKGLVEGEEGNQEGPVNQSNNPEIEGGEEPGGSASVADAYQNSDDPAGDAERAAREERIAEGLEEPATLPPPTATNEDGGTGKDVDKQLDDNEKFKLGRALKNVAAIHNQRAAKKWGSTNRGKRWVNRGRKVLGRTARFAVRATGVGAGTLAGGALGMMFGKGAAGAGAGMVLGSKLGNKVIKGATGAIATVKDYKKAFSTNSTLERKALDTFKSDPKQIDKAVQSYRKNHGGQEPSNKDLEREIQDRFDLSRYNLNEEQIDNSVGSYQNLVDGGMLSTDALNQTVYSAKLANDYSKKDFRSEKTMREAVDTISKRFIAQGAKTEVANAAARDYLAQAAVIKGTEIALDIPVMSSSLGMDSSKLTTKQVERINQVTFKLHNAGFSNRQIERMASNCAGGITTEVLNKYEATVEYLNDGKAQAEVKAMLGGKATKSSIQSEMKERLILKSTFNVKGEDKISQMRDSELRAKTQVQAAREFAIKNRGKLNNEAHMKGVREDLVRKLRAGGSSGDKALKDAENIINLARQYNNE